MEFIQQGIDKSLISFDEDRKYFTYTHQEKRCDCATRKKTPAHSPQAGLLFTFESRSGQFSATAADRFFTLRM
jgi:hypothetical protein